MAPVVVYTQLLWPHVDRETVFFLQETVTNQHLLQQCLQVSTNGFGLLQDLTVQYSNRCETFTCAYRMP